MPPSTDAARPSRWLRLRVAASLDPLPARVLGHEAIVAICNHRHMNVVAGDPTPQGESVLDAVLTASRVLVAIAARSLADVADEVTLTQYRSLVVLASRGPQSSAALADELGVTPSTVSRLCDRLVRKGLVRRREDRRDRRAVRLALTPAGRELVDAVTERRRTEIAG